MGNSRALEQYRVEQYGNNLVIPAAGEISLAFANPEFLSRLSGMNILITVRPSGSEFSSRFVTDECYLLPGSVFLAWMKDPSSFPLKLPEKYIQFFYMEPGTELTFEGHRMVEGKKKLSIDTTIRDKRLSLFWDEEHQEYVIYLPSARLRTHQEMLLDLFPEDAVIDQIIRVTPSDVYARKVFDATCRLVRSKIDITSQEIYEFIHEYRRA